MATSMRCICRVGASARQALAARSVSRVSPALPDEHPRNDKPSRNAIPQRRTMAGHNKWSKIKRKKGANDAARAASHGRIARAIQAASRRCGGDASDLHLQSAVAAARAAQLPKDRIECAIDRGANPSRYAGEELADMRYDGTLSTKSGKVALVVAALTDNKNRSAANVRAHFRKCGGEMTESGSNDWMFDHIGFVTVPMGVCGEGNGNDNDGAGDDSTLSLLQEEAEEALLECALEGGASDVDIINNDDNKEEHGVDDDDEVSKGPFAAIRCEPTDLHKVVTALTDDGYSPDEFGTRYVVKDKDTGLIELCDESIETLEKLLEKLDGEDDVAQVYHNASY